MRLLKENAFLVATIGTVVVIGTILVVMQRSASADADAGAKVRTDQSVDMNRLANAPVNRRTVRAAIAREDAMRDEAAKVAADFLQSNRKDYKVIVFALPNQAVPAFPIDKDLYTREDLRLLFPREYEKRVKALLASLSPARPPSPEEIQAEQERVAAALAATPATGAPTGVAPRPVPRPVPTGTTMLPTGSYGLGVGARRPPPTGGIAPRTATQPAKTPEQRAVDKLIRTCAHRGLVYADEQSMDPIMVPGSSMRYTDSQLWMAQVSLWVQKDVVAAIVATNENVRRRAAPGQKGVPASAVKHLKAIKVIGYVVGDTGGGVGGVEGGGGMQGGGGMYGVGGTTGAPPGMGGTSHRLVYVGLAPGLQQARPERLSRRACDTNYDVVQYEFTVVIPFRYLPKLYRKLLERQYHTILKAQVGESTTTQQPGMTMGAGPTATAQEYYYYGTDPVVQVTLTGELLLAAEWTRGRWDEKNNAWDKAYPALMPDAFLAMIQRYDGSALRPEDAKRASAVMTVGPTYGTFP